MQGIVEFTNKGLQHNLKLSQQFGEDKTFTSLWSVPINFNLEPNNQATVNLLGRKSTFTVPITGTVNF